MRHAALSATLVPIALGVLLLPAGAQPQGGPNQNQAPNQQVQPPPKVADPVEFKSKDGKIKGWKVVIPGNKALATPAVVDGKVFVGGGFGSHEFYAFDAATGKLAWRYQTADDGPTAAVVSDGCVAFNTESCELEIVTMEGKPLWKKWLGDPLMSMPALGDGKVFMAYPNSKGDKEHHLACFELKTGKELWKQKIAGEVITAPVLDNGQVYAATLDGSLYCFKDGDGTLVWQEKKNATSSPMVWDGNCYFSRRDEVTVKKDGKDVKQQNEQVAARGTTDKGTVNDLKETARPAPYLDYGKRKDGAVEKQLQSDDAGVGFGAAKGDAKIGQAQANLGQASVRGIWAYQGSRPFVSKGQMFSAMGDEVTCIDPKTEKVVWKKSLRKEGEKGELLDAVLTPPALVNDKVFVGTASGEVRCLSAKTGELLWSVSVGEPVAFQPAVVKGRVYVSTSGGSLFALETGDDKDDGWAMWGANAGHNGVP
jgi:Ca-activated chloride channel family protein